MVVHRGNKYCHRFQILLCNKFIGIIIWYHSDPSFNHRQNTMLSDRIQMSLTILLSSLVLYDEMNICDETGTCTNYRYQV